MRLIPSIVKRTRYAVFGRGARPASFARSLDEVFGSSAESAVHPHVASERAELYRAVDEGSTELEVLGAINALAHLFKPRTALETGTWHGFGTLAIASAMRMNGFGRLHTVDNDPGAHKMARRHFALYDPKAADHVAFELSDSREFIAGYRGDPFDFVFIDSAMACRLDEFLELERRGLFAPGGVCMVHDTSRHRPEYADGATEAMTGLDELHAALSRYEGFEFPYSRGFRFARMTPRA